jgi:elongation factor 1-beta
MDLNVAANIRIMPEGVEIDLEKILKSVEKIVSKHGKLNSSEIKPIAFGLKALEIMVLLSDKEGGMEEMEAAMAEVPGVNSVEILEVPRL